MIFDQNYGTQGNSVVPSRRHPESPALREADVNLSWADLNVLTLSSVHIPGMEI